MVVHYGGHGVIHKGVTQAFVNDPDPKKSLYAIEQMIRDLSKIKGGYIIALLDCCRHEWDAQRMRGLSNA